MQLYTFGDSRFKRHAASAWLVADGKCGYINRFQEQEGGRVKVRVRVRVLHSEAKRKRDCTKAWMREREWMGVTVLGA